MTDDSPQETATPSGAALTDEEKRTILLVVAGLVVALVLSDVVRRIERRFARRHPLLTELVEGTAHRPRQTR